MRRRSPGNDIHDHQGVEPQKLKPGIVPTIPLRALIPKGSRNLLVAGRSISSDRAANSALRVQASCMAMGQAAGAAAALAASRKVSPLEVPIADIRALLLKHGALFARLTDRSSVMVAADRGTADERPVGYPAGICGKLRRSRCCRHAAAYLSLRGSQPCRRYRAHQVGDAQPAAVRTRLAGEAWILVAVMCCNLVAHDERVKPVISVIPSFASGQRMTLRKCSLTVVAWEAAANEPVSPRRTP